LILVAVVAAAVAAVAVGAVMANRPTAVETVTVTAEKTERVLAVVGRVRPLDLLQIKPVNPGQVIRLLHDEGDRVAAGAPLAVIKAPVEQAQAEAELARLAAARARAVEARQSLSRTTSLFERGFAARAALDQARAAANSAEADVNAAAAGYRAATARTREFVVTAPMAGIVLARPIDNGQVVTTATTLFDFGAVSGVEVVAEVDEAYADTLRPGMAARVSPSGSRAVYRAVVSEVSPRVDASTGGRIVRLLPETVSGFAPGRSIDVTIVVVPGEPLITVPRQAVADATVAPKVFVVGPDDVARARPVRIADWPSTNAIVKSGLKAGERIVLAPTEGLDGTRVRAARPAR
jgi:RND family efflux transporter MFP subunit